MFLYFVPGAASLSRESLASLGLAYLLDKGGPFTQRGVSGAGPSGGSGAICAVVGSDLSGHVKVDLAAQTWRKIPGSEVWVGHYKDRLPRPEQLARCEQLAGHMLELADSGRWIVPIARGWAEYGEGEAAELRWRVCLPQRLDLAPDGTWTYAGVMPRYATLWELAERWLNSRSSDVRPFSGQEEIDGAVSALQANYCLGRVEAGLLGMFTSELAVRVLDALIDWPTMHEFLKKKGIAEVLSNLRSGPSPNTSESATPTTPPAGSSSTAGPAAETAPTAPRSPT